MGKNARGEQFGEEEERKEVQSKGGRASARRERSAERQRLSRASSNIPFSASFSGALIPAHKYPTATIGRRKHAKRGVSMESAREKRPTRGRHSLGDARTRGPSFFPLSLLASRSLPPPALDAWPQEKKPISSKNAPHKDTKRLAFGSTSSSAL